MSVKPGMPYDAHIVELYTSGMAPGDIVKEVGVTSKNVIYRALKRCGVKPRGNRLGAPSGIVERYESGTSVLELANIYSVSRPTVTRWLTEAGCELRGRSEAGLVRASKMTPEERARQAEAAHDASRGSHLSIETKLKHSRTVELNASIDRASKGERIITEKFISLGYDVTLQKSVHIYNLDVAVGNRFAVEVLGGNFHSMRSRREKETERLEYLISSGWRLVYLWDTKVVPITDAAADKCVSILKMTSIDPSPDGEYWVVRGDGKVTTAARRYVTDDALVLPTQASTNPDGSEISIW